MHIKVVKAGGYEYVRLVESYREDGEIKQRIVLNLGRKDHIEGNSSFMRLAERLAEIAGGAKKGLSLEAISEGVLKRYGFLPYRKLWKTFALDSFFAKQQRENPRLRIDLNDACFLMVVQHLLSPRSKLATYERREQYLGIPEMDLNHLYRSLDLLADQKEDIESFVFAQNLSLFSMNVDVVFYDVTTFHFESVKADGFKEFGFSKANKVNEVQVVMGLLVDGEGRPIGYELFPGNTFDSKTLEMSLEKLSKRFHINRVVIVADRGINSKLNLKCIKDKGYDYIVASRLKRASNKILEEVFNPEGYTTLAEGLLYKVLDHCNRVKENGETVELAERLIVTHSAKRAAKDRADRERLVEKARRMVSSPASIKASNKRGGKKFIVHKSEKDEYSLDESAIARDERFDGYYAIQVSNDLSPAQVLDAYHSLWRIEESFRIMKSTLEVRPIFHWTEQRIKGHFVVCFLAFLLERTLELRLQANEISVSPTEIQEALHSLCFTETEINGQKYLLKMKPSPTASAILRALRVAPPKNIMPLEEAADFAW